MIKNNMKKLILSSVIILLPIVVGLLLWNTMPDKLATHWGVNGAANGWSSRAFAIFALPVFLLVSQWICALVTLSDPKNKDQGKKALGIVFWICPLASVFSSAIMYATAFGLENSIERILPVFLGLLFIIVGNYLPKCKQNYTIGIKLPWTLSNDENWNKTHRLAGKLWVISGLFFMVSILLPKLFMTVILPLGLIPTIIVPIIYSYALYKKQPQDKACISAEKKTTIKKNTIYIIVVLFVATVMGAAIGILNVTGDIEIQYGDTAFTIKATYWGDLKVDYEAIDSIDYRQECEVGSRTNGFGSSRLLMGSFSNNEFGAYTRYSYTKNKSGVVMKIDDKTLVIGGIDDNSTRAIYDELVERMKR